MNTRRPACLFLLFSPPSPSASSLSTIKKRGRNWLLRVQVSPRSRSRLGRSACELSDLFRDSHLNHHVPHERSSRLSSPQTTTTDAQLLIPRPAAAADRRRPVRPTAWNAPSGIAHQATSERPSREGYTLRSRAPQLLQGPHPFLVSGDH